VYTEVQHGHNKDSTCSSYLTFPQISTLRPTRWTSFSNLFYFLVALHMFRCYKRK